MFVNWFRQEMSLEDTLKHKRAFEFARPTYDFPLSSVLSDQDVCSLYVTCWGPN